MKEVDATSLDILAGELTFGVSVTSLEGSFVPSEILSGYRAFMMGRKSITRVCFPKRAIGPDFILYFRKREDVEKYFASLGESIKKTVKLDY